MQAELQQSCGAALQPRAQFPLQSTGLGAAAQHWGLWEGAQLAQGDAVPSAWLWAMLSVQPGNELHLPCSNIITETLGRLPEIDFLPGWELFSRKPTYPKKIFVSLKRATGKGRAVITVKMQLWW